MGGMRGVGFAALLGLSDFRKDAFTTGLHAYLLQRKYPHAEIAFSCPRLRARSSITIRSTRRTCTSRSCCRSFVPTASSCRSRPSLSRPASERASAIISSASPPLKISAGVDVGIGGHSGEDKGDEQFEISDGRSVDEVYNAICEHGLAPVMADYLYITNFCRVSFSAKQGRTGETSAPHQIQSPALPDFNTLPALSSAVRTRGGYPKKVSLGTFSGI